MEEAVEQRVVDALRLGGGVVRRRDLLATGLGRRDLERLVRTGGLRVVAPHVLAGPVPSPGERERSVAVALGAVLSHETAARLHGLDAGRAGPVHVTVPRDRSRCRAADVVVHRVDLPGRDVELVDGVRCTTLARTVVDLARTLPLGRSVPVLDAALRSGCLGQEELLGLVRAMPAQPGRRRAVLAASLTDVGAASVLESSCRLLLARGGLPPPTTQHVVRVGGRFLARVDFAWPEHRLAVETDGFAWHSDRERYRADRRRLNALVLAGWRVLRFSWEDVVGRPDDVLAQVRAALSAEAA